MRSVNRRTLLQVAGAAILTACTHRPRTRIPRLGFLTGAHNQQMADAFLNEMRRLGWIDGATIDTTMRTAQPNSGDAAAYAAELAGSGLDLIVVSALPYALEVRRENPRLPMVIGTGAGLVANGFAQSMERPGLLTTGMEELVPGLTGKRMRLLRQLAPGLRSMALLSTTPGTGGHEIQLADATETATLLGVAVRPYRATNLGELRQAFYRIASDEMEGLVNFQGGLSLANRQLIVDFAAAQRIPAIYQAVLFAEAGGLMTWAPDQNDQLRTAARLADQILRGARPGDLPITYPPRYFLTINLGAARRLGLAIPASLRNSADRLVD